MARGEGKRRWIIPLGLLFEEYSILPKCSDESVLHVPCVANDFLYV